MSADGRTVWWAKDAAWWRREPVVELLEEVGPVGPCVVDWLACEAKAQNAGGVVKAGQRSIARALNIELVTVGHALSAAVAVGLLDDFEEDGRTFTCRISGWRSEQERALGAARKARSRALADASHGESRPVTPCPEMSTTGQDSTEGTTDPPNPPRGEPADDSVGDGPVFPGRKPKSNRSRDLIDWEQRVGEYAAVHWPTVDEEERAGLLRSALQTSTVSTVGQAHAWVDRYIGEERAA